MSSKIVEYKPKASRLSEYPRLSDLLNLEFEIVRVEFGETSLGKYAIVSVRQKVGKKKYEIKQYVTSSRVLIKQLMEIEELLEDPKIEAVKVKLQKVKRYYTF
ncbi:MAG: hypothetical protein JRD89_19355 [Deltaproteobacteria bacterium]|nr:hypothetical protein [Deltaproteobacteria bacterium]